MATAGYVTNWRLVAADRGYFADFAVPSPLQHTWSLAVEEQWYLVWPLLLGALLRRRRGGSRRRAIGLRPTHPPAPGGASGAPVVAASRPDAVVVGFAAAAAVASLVWAAHLARPGADPSRVYYGTDTRAHLLLVGSLLAMVLARRGRFEAAPRWRGLTELGGVAGLAAVVGMALTVDDTTSWLYEGGSALLAAAVVAVLFAVLQPRSALGSALAAGPLRRVGELSYGLYLWHVPAYVVLSASRTGLSGTALLALRLAATGALALGCEAWIERPVRRGSWPLPKVLLTTVTASVVVVAAVAGAVAVRAPDAGAPALGAGLATGRGDMFRYDPAANPPPTTLVDDPAVRVQVTGDSVALTTSLGFDQRGGDPPVLLWDTSVLGCTLFEGERVATGVRTDGGPQCAAWRADVDRWRDAYDAEVVALLAGVWEVYDRVVDGRRLAFGSPEFDRWFSSRLDSLVTRLGQPDTPVALLTAPCNRRAETLDGTEPPENDADRVEHLNELYRAAARRRPDKVHVVDLAAFACPGGRFRASIDGVSLRAEDGAHFSASGGQLVRAWLYPRLAALARP